MLTHKCDRGCNKGCGVGQVLGVELRPKFNELDYAERRRISKSSLTYNDDRKRNAKVDDVWGATDDLMSDRGRREYRRPLHNDEKVRHRAGV